MTELSLPQAETLSFIKEFQIQHRCSPSLMDVSMKFRINKTSAYNRMQLLKEKGLITYHGRKLQMLPI